MDLDPVIMSRIQFAVTMTLHIIFPAFTIGLAVWIAVLEALWLSTRRLVYLELSNFWLRIFALSFGMGVVSGIVMSFQFGTNWANFSRVAGNIFGPLMSYETTVAFMLEATFLGVLLLGRRRVSEAFYLTAACLVVAGTTLSAFFILSANSWMHTPQGFIEVNGRLEAVDWWAIIFNPSFLPRLAHMMLACWLTAAFVIMGVGAVWLLRGRFKSHARVMVSLPLWIATVLLPLQMAAGHWSGLVVGQYQPAKLAAIEARWEAEQPASLVLFAWPNSREERNEFALVVPAIGSWVDADSPTARLPGLKDFPADARPPVVIPFFSFRVMVGVGLAMLAVAVAGAFLRRRGALFTRRWFLAALAVMSPSGFIAIEAGWLTTEVGRQPWIIYNVLRTREAVSAVSGEVVLASMTVILLVYAIVFSAGFVFIFRRLMAGPAIAVDGEIPAKRPLSAHADGAGGADTYGADR